MIAISMIVFTSIPAFAQSADSGSWNLIGYVQMATDVSAQIEKADRAVTNAQEKLEETRLSGAIEMDLQEARSSVESAKLALAEAKNAVAIQAVTKYVDYLRASRALEFAGRQLDIMAQSAEMAKQRYDEGVKTEAAYLNDVTAKLNSEISFLQSKNAREAARRSLLRFVKVSLQTTTEIDEVKLPYVSMSIDDDELIAAIQAASSSYFGALNAANFAQTRHDALSRLSNSVTQKELESAKLAADAAKLNFENASAAIEDQAWSLETTLEVRSKSVEAGEQMLGMAENSWEKQEEQHAFGLISDLQRDSYALSFDTNKDSAIRKVEDHFFHVLKIEQAKGSEIISVLRDKIR